jgi:hypothetical protein
MERGIQSYFRCLFQLSLKLGAKLGIKSDNNCHMTQRLHRAFAEKKRAERPQEQECIARTKYNEQRESIRQLWPQLVLQSLKNKCVCKFRDQPSGPGAKISFLFVPLNRVTKNNLHWHIILIPTPLVCT